MAARLRRPPAVSASDPLDLSYTEASLGWRPEFDIGAGLSHYAEEFRRLETQWPAIRGRAD